MVAASPPGVLYADGDYAGFFRRFLILGVDAAVLAGLWAILLFLQRVLDPDVPLSGTLFWVGAGLSWAYLTLLEATVGTLGLRMTGTRVVTLEGKRPTVFRMTFRLLIWIFGPINAFVDFFWLGGDAYKQTLRDKFAGTLVVRKSATPVGTGDIRLNRYQFLVFSLVFYEVSKPAA